MEFERSNGVISFGGGILGPKLDRNSFLAAPFTRNAKLVLKNGPWETYEFQIEFGIICNVVFNGEKLVEIRFFMTDADEKNWLKEKEVDRKKYHEKWLYAKLGSPPYIYNWGKVESVFDPRSECSQIIVRYSTANIAF